MYARGPTLPVLVVVVVLLLLLVLPPTWLKISSDSFQPGVVRCAPVYHTQGCQTLLLIKAAVCSYSAAAAADCVASAVVAADVANGQL